MLLNMIFLVWMTLLATLTMPLVVNGQEDNDTTTHHSKVLYEDSMVLQESFYAAMASFADSTLNETKERGNLRRGLQTNPVCRATPSVGNTLVCGGWAGGNDDPCRNSQATCNSLTYGCSCSGSSETTCSYCQVRTANAILCQPSGATTTFRDLDGNMMTCSCEYIGNGEVSQNCRAPTPVSIPFPTPAPVAVRAPSAPVPTLAVPIAGATGPPAYTATPTVIMQTPPTSTQVATATPTVIMLTPPTSTQVSTATPTVIVQTAPPINPQVTCRATNPFNVNLGYGASCAALANYPCSCSGAGDTSCNYCQVQTANAVICQVTGSEVTYIDPTGALKTCYCEYRGNGQAQQYCYQEGGPAPTYPVAAPVWTPTSQRAPTTATMPVTPVGIMPVTPVGTMPVTPVGTRSGPTPGTGSNGMSNPPKKEKKTNKRD